MSNFDTKHQIFLNALLLGICTFYFLKYFEKPIYPIFENKTQE